MAKEGKDTSEYQARKESSWLGTLAMILGIIVASGTAVAAAITDVNPTAGIIAGAVVSVAGIIQKTMFDLGYIKGRSAVKAAQNGRLKPGNNGQKT